MNHYMKAWIHQELNQRNSLIRTMEKYGANADKFSKSNEKHQSTVICNEYLHYIQNIIDYAIKSESLTNRAQCTKGTEKKRAKRYLTDNYLQIEGDIKNILKCIKETPEVEDLNAAVLKYIKIWTPPLERRNKRLYATTTTNSKSIKRFGNDKNEGRRQKQVCVNQAIHHPTKEEDQAA